MARPLRIEFSGALYHVMARGNARADIYSDDSDFYPCCIIQSIVTTGLAMPIISRNPFAILIQRHEISQ